MWNLTTTTMKYLLFVFNLVFLLAGISLVAIGFITKAAFQEYQPFLDGSFITPSNLLILVGVCVFLIAFFGCWGSFKENYCMVYTFSLLMAAIFVAEISLGVTGYVLRDESIAIATKGLNSTMPDYNKSAEIAKLWDTLQDNMDCCGTTNYTNWVDTIGGLPMSCCASQRGTIGVFNCTVKSATLKKTPCFSVLGNYLRENAARIGFAGITVAIIQLLGVVFACSLGRSIRNSYESV